MSKYKTELDKLNVPENTMEGLNQKMKPVARRYGFRGAVVVAATIVLLSITAMAGAILLGAWNVQMLGLFDRETYIENVREWFPAYEPDENHQEGFVGLEGKYVVSATAENNVQELNAELYDEIYEIFAWAQKTKPFRATDEELAAMSQEEKDEAFYHATVNPVKKAMLFSNMNQAQEKLGVRLLQSDLLELQPDEQIEMNVFKLKTGMLTGEETREEIPDGFQIWLRGNYEYPGKENVTVQLRQEFMTVAGYPTSATFTYDEAVKITTEELGNGIVAQYGADSKTANAFVSCEGVACTIRIQTQNGEVLGKETLEAVMMEILESLR